VIGKHTRADQQCAPAVRGHDHGEGVRGAVARQAGPSGTSSQWHQRLPMLTLLQSEGGKGQRRGCAPAVVLKT
jgi:hypothetical protein